MNLAKTPIRISYAAQRLPELLTLKLFSPEIAHDWSTSYELLSSKLKITTTLAYTGHYYQLTPKLIPLRDATQHSQSEHSAQSNQNIPDLNPAKTPVRISYTAQLLPELLTHKLFSLKIDRDKNQRNTQLCSSAKNRSSQISFNSRIKHKNRQEKKEEYYVDN
ncbi:hypothetical protein F511_38187 [Dorcoceras hygrometricum]|uniref:Uncharacterized protein n=1 Tax=Dorcoceras hygrometricum TaxID=472368 RepID=A0A2Z7CXD9_9LAMI|nr:hypothetical protein F511_38187 [Dorcoceras hygrometricum]